MSFGNIANETPWERNSFVSISLWENWCCHRTAFCLKPQKLLTMLNEDWLYIKQKCVSYQNLVQQSYPISLTLHWKNLKPPKAPPLERDGTRVQNHISGLLPLLLPHSRAKDEIFLCIWKVALSFMKSMCLSATTLGHLSARTLQMTHRIWACVRCFLEELKEAGLCSELDDVRKPALEHPLERIVYTV